MSFNLNRARVAPYGQGFDIVSGGHHVPKIISKDQKSHISEQLLGRHKHNITLIIGTLFTEGARYLELRLLLETKGLSNEENAPWEPFIRN